MKQSLNNQEQINFNSYHSKSILKVIKATLEPTNNIQPFSTGRGNQYNITMLLRNVIILVNFSFILMRFTSVQGKMMPGSFTLDGSINTYSSKTLCNYNSPLAEKFIYQNTLPQHQAVKPYRRHLFRLKVQTAAELRFFELQKKYMLTNKNKQPYGMITMGITELDHMSNIIPKDEYEIRKKTSYLMSKKISKDSETAMQTVWEHHQFRCESATRVGMFDSANFTKVRSGTDEEFITFFWFYMTTSSAMAFMATASWWWWKYGQAPEYVEMK